MTSPHSETRPAITASETACFDEGRLPSDGIGGSLKSTGKFSITKYGSPTGEKKLLKALEIVTGKCMRTSCLERSQKAAQAFRSCQSGKSRAEASRVQASRLWPGNWSVPEVGGGWLASMSNPCTEAMVGDHVTRRC